MICGADEAGRGPVLGPLVLAAVMVENDRPLRRLNVKDSKALDPKKREELYPQIMECARVEVAVVSPEEIDARGKDSLNDLEVQHFATLIDRLSPHTVYVDAVDVNAERFGRNICDRLDCQATVVSCHRADAKYPVVSAASIIAKVTRDRLVWRLGRDLGEEVGSGYPNDSVTMDFLERWIRKNGTFPPQTRRSWATARKTFSKCKVTKLTDWMDKS
ncbi:MAG: ribonuclease HII [Euryarchaeota archaeon]|nr:ribonuclease HII [Euryarchaeota archaeon]